ncbi:hypothetical protein WR25_09793 [Diploscapter pachys]|uniref:Uncharacterized protein n=1 Tax=Diploscapter pachys TaxID=2018661 RepID=A0A2A2KG81_9BILA|nr:hypothetical protein WR25_09793 [Diploscapter pachys]
MEKEGMSKSHRKSEPVAGPSKKPTRREIYEFMIRTGVRLEARNRTTCSAITTMHRLLDTDLASHICHYVNFLFRISFLFIILFSTLAGAAFLVAIKHEEDNLIGIRDVINAMHRILHEDEEPLKIDSQLWDIRKGLAKLEFVVLRQLGFDIHFDDPFKPLSLYLDQLRSWMPDEFEEYKVVDNCFAVMRDCFVDPEFVESHSTASLAISVISVVLKGFSLEVPHSRAWFEVLHKTMSESKLRRLEKDILSIVYQIDVE